MKHDFPMKSPKCDYNMGEGQNFALLGIFVAANGSGKSVVFLPGRW
ncbi:MAG: hypothetical protein LBU69_03775 [Deltaproteobacteria bacterium]|jgi:hypothetical protein|nr:hypothetical protein [Deltaproteobacteria bacterium]